MEDIKVGDIRVWHIPQVPGKAFHVMVDDFAQGEKICDLLALYDNFQFDNNIKPDFSNAQGIERYEDNGEGGYGWYDIDPEFDEMFGQGSIDPEWNEMQVN